VATTMKRTLITKAVLLVAATTFLWASPARLRGDGELTRRV